MAAVADLALDQALRDIEPVLFGFAMRAVRDREVARDLVQETLLAGISQPASFAGRSSLRTWLVGILSHKAIDHFRRLSAAPLTDAHEEALLATPSDEDVERAIAARQDLRTVEGALATLSAQERMATLMVDVEGLAREEVCRVLGVTATHLRVLLHRARHKMRKVLERGT